ncbi:YdcF family protein [Fischerella sp.]|uniref:YdcF family protein n=1 Tax=Fischerella sp. TaxID=1191 RepID=UPI0025BF0752|nr:YdcF family protein [Fischerella sp.]
MLALAGLLLTLLLMIPVRLSIARIQAPQPQAFLILGGEPAREKYTAELAQWYPSLEIWVSSGIHAEETRKIFSANGVRSTRVHIDHRAVDTVTNFTTLIPDFRRYRIQHLFLITSDFHMPRAKAIATLVLGSQGIAFTPVSVPSNQPKESNLRILRDICRSLLWIVTGRTGASLQSAVDLP